MVWFRAATPVVLRVAWLPELLLGLALLFVLLPEELPLDLLEEEEELLLRLEELLVLLLREVLLTAIR